MAFSSQFDFIYSISTMHMARRKSFSTFITIHQVIYHNETSSNITMRGLFKLLSVYAFFFLGSHALTSKERWLTEGLVYIRTTLAIRRMDSHLRLNGNSNQSELPHCIFRPLSIKLLGVELWVGAANYYYYFFFKGILPSGQGFLWGGPHVPACLLIHVHLNGCGGNLHIQYAYRIHAHRQTYTQARRQCHCLRLTVHAIVTQSCRFFADGFDDYLKCSISSHTYNLHSS